MKIPSILIGKALISASKINGGHGTAMPGLVVEKLDPNILQNMVRQLPDGVVFITGTNGKTTTTKMVVEMLEGIGKRVLTNKSGSNFTRGIISTLVDKANVTGKLNYDIAILEVDEAYSPKLAELMKPKAILALNVHRDQLDRYGEIDTTAGFIGDAMAHCDHIVVNNNEELLVRQSERHSGATIHYFGLSKPLQKQLTTDENLHRSEKNIFKSQHANNVTLKSLKAHKLSQDLTIKVRGEDHVVTIKLPGVHNASNAAAAATLTTALYPEYPIAEMIEHLSRVKAAFGRGEYFEVNGSDLHLGLVKNPSGFNQNLKTLVDSDTTDVMFVVNDDYADGRDVSWLWDIDFASHTETLQDTHIYVSGVRAYDMAVRLQQEGLKPVVVNTNLKQVLSELLLRSYANRDIVIMPTYTAMLEVRDLLKTYEEDGSVWV